MGSNGYRDNKTQSSEPLETHQNSLTPTFLSARPNFLSEGVRFGAKSKLARMGVYLAYIPIRDNELGAEDDPLSQEITRGDRVHSLE